MRFFSVGTNETVHYIRVSKWVSVKRGSTVVQKNQIILFKQNTVHSGFNVGRCPLISNVLNSEKMANRSSEALYTATQYCFHYNPQHHHCNFSFSQIPAGLCRQVQQTTSFGISKSSKWCLERGRASYFSRQIGFRNKTLLAYISVQFGYLNLKFCMPVRDDIAFTLLKNYGNPKQSLQRPGIP